MAVVKEKQWWGEFDGTLHLFMGFGGDVGPIREASVAECGWSPTSILMESPHVPQAERALR